MNKEEFLAFSLPYGLKVYDCISKLIELVDYSKGCSKCICEEIGKTKNENKCVNVFRSAFYKQFKPILHPLSDLTKGIEHCGIKFIPMAELARINFGSNYVNTLKINGFDNSFIKFLGRGDTGGESPEYTYSEVLFEFNHYNLSFCVNDLDNKNTTHCDSIKQLELLLKLLEWHFDIAGLIEKKEAIDVNTLENNPYK